MATAADTNILLRLILDDGPAQAARVRSLVEHTVATGQALFVPDVVLCEFAWVLGRSYRVRRQELETTLRGLADAAHLTFESGERLERALEAFAVGRGDFPDYLIRGRARDAGCDRVATFDQALLRENGFVAP